MLLHMKSQVMSACVLRDETTATRTIEKMMTMIVREKTPIRASLFLHDIFTFHSIKMGIVMTECVLVDLDLFVGLTGLTHYVRDHINSTIIMQSDSLELYLVWVGTMTYCR